MNNEEPYRDQAEKLKQKIGKYHELELEDSVLPSRSELHRKKKKKTKWKLKYPLIRLLVLFFILLPITIFSIYSYIGSKHIVNEKTSVSSKGFETINFEKSKSEQIKQSTHSTKEKNTNSQEQKDKNTSAGLDNSVVQTAASEAAGKEQTSISQNVPQSNGIEAGQSTDKSTNNQAAPALNQPNTAQVQKGSTTNKMASEKIIYHTVKPHETLYHIAISYYHSKTGVETIKAANHLRSDSITAGQVLKIPLKN